tara:strand:- start:1024 stop:2520 length:1497 start_codon:yes stop_codon:yes gene_type:complete
MFYRIRYTVAVALLLVSTLFVINGCKGTSESFSTSSPVGKPTVRPTATKIPMKKPVVQPTATKMTAVEEKVESTDVGSSNNSESHDIAYSTIFTLATDYEQFPDDIQAKFQSIVDQEFSAIKDKSGMSVAIYTDGLLWTYATGKSSESTELTVNTPMMISSTSKTVLSALILVQINRGLYKLSDSLETVLSGHPDFSSFPTDKINTKVTVEELLTMSTGLPNFNDNMQGKSELAKSSSWRPADLINLVETVYSEPGIFEYNDTNVVLLGMIAEFHSGQGLADLYRQTFYDPLSITAITLPEEGIQWHSDILHDPGDKLTIPAMAMPYGDISRWSSGYGNIIDAAPFEFGYYVGAIGRNRYACCGIVSTPQNMSRWAYELYSTNGSAISEPIRFQLLNSFSEKRIPPWSSSTRPGIIPEQYGYLVSRKTFKLTGDRTITAYGHLGGGAGYSAWMHYSSELDMSVSIIANSELKVSGTCGTEDPGNCIASNIFSAYLDKP